jgi:hypothetical protein
MALLVASVVACAPPASTLHPVVAVASVAPAPVTSLPIEVEKPSLLGAVDHLTRKAPLDPEDVKASLGISLERDLSGHAPPGTILYKLRKAENGPFRAVRLLVADPVTGDRDFSGVLSLELEPAALTKDAVLDRYGDTPTPDGTSEGTLNGVVDVFYARPWGVLWFGLTQREPASVVSLSIQPLPISVQACDSTNDASLAATLRAAGVLDTDQCPVRRTSRPGLVALSSDWDVIACRPQRFSVLWGCKVVNATTDSGAILRGLGWEYGDKKRAARIYATEIWRNRREVLTQPTVDFDRSKHVFAAPAATERADGSVDVVFWERQTKGYPKFQLWTISFLAHGYVGKASISEFF